MKMRDTACSDPGTRSVPGFSKLQCNYDNDKTCHFFSRNPQYLACYHAQGEKLLWPAVNLHY